jgi:ribose transport system substrate-binding protein
MFTSNRTRRITVAGAALAASTFLLAGCASAASQSSEGAGSEFDYTGPASDSPEAAALIETSGVVEDDSWCGDEPITVGVADAFGTNGWSANSYAVVRSELAKCDNVTQVVTAGQGDLTKAISDVSGLVAQGVDALVIIPSLGEGQLPSLQEATRAGVAVVPWGADPGGEPGTDYVAYVDWDTVALGETWGEWVVSTLGPEGGDVVYLGGPAGNPVSTGTLEGLVSAFDGQEQIELLTGDTDFPVTNWNPSEAQSVMSSLLAKYPQIDAVVVDDGVLGEAVMRAFSSAGRPLPIIATNEINLFSCAFDEAKASNPDFAMATISNRNWLGRIAAHKAVAAAQGLEPAAEPSTYTLPLQEDSVNGPAPVCDPEQSSDAAFSSAVSAEDLDEYGNAN